MILYPAVDLKDGQCVRLLRGEMDRATVFSEDPVRQVKKFSDQGFKWLHIVDLNGAIQGRAVHKELIKEMVRSTELEVQLGGGIRSMEVLEAWIDVGVSRVVLGTAALYNPELVRNACKQYPGRIAVGIDGRDGRVAVKGWVEQSEILAIDLARRFEDEGVSLRDVNDILTICNKNALYSTIKIGGCEAKTDSIICMNLDVNAIVAPMVETPYAFKKFCENFNFSSFKSSSSFIDI